MKLFSYFLVVVILFLMSCDGADHVGFDDDNCFFVLNLDPQEDQRESCKARFLFMDEDGTQYEFKVDVKNGTDQLISLPKGKCYKVYLGSVGCNPESDMEWSIINEELEFGFEFTHYLESRNEIISLDHPDFEFCLDDDCSFPKITDHR